MRGLQLESRCMKNSINQLKKILEKNNISLPQGEDMSEYGEKTKEYERFHALKEGFTQSKAYLIYSGASNHMVSSKESFTSLDIFGQPSIHMGDDSQIPTVGKGSIKIEHGLFHNILYVPSLEANLLFVYQMTHIGLPK